MNGYRIDYIFQAPANCPAPHAQIVKVGIGNAAGHNPVWTVDEVIQAMKKGAIFYTIGPRTGKFAKVMPFVCHHCGRFHIRSSAEAVDDNNIDNLTTLNLFKITGHS